MILSSSSILSLTNIITGNSGISPEHKFEDIQDLLKRYTKCESLEEYKNSIETHELEEYEIIQRYVISKLNKINGTSLLTKLVEQIFNNISFFQESTNIESSYNIEENIFALNSVIKNDNYEIFRYKTKYRVYGLNDSLVDYQCLFCKNKLGAYTVIKDQIEKCYAKVISGDYSGAITNARTLLEQILREIECSLNPDAVEYDGNLPKLYRRVTNLLNFEDGLSEKMKTIYQQILGGLSSSINGFAGLRNTMSDAHPIERIPSENDAILAINESKTLTNFIVRHYFEHYVNAA